MTAFCGCGMYRSTTRHGLDLAITATIPNTRRHAHTTSRLITGGSVTFPAIPDTLRARWESSCCQSITHTPHYDPRANLAVAGLHSVVRDSNSSSCRR